MSLRAHSENEAGITQLLGDHLAATAELAAERAGKWDASEWGRFAGLLHDTGKVSERFQRYLRGVGVTGGDHSTLGAAQVPDECAPVAFAIAGHHGGLPDLAALKARRSEARASPSFADLTARVGTVVELPMGDSFPSLAPGVERNRLDVELFTRMLFSALVDADYLDTERHFREGQARARGAPARMADLWARFEGHQRRLIGEASDTPVNRIRTDVYRLCLEAAQQHQGLFGLTVPTGGGKTLSGMGFALRHALKWDLDRIIVVIPYTSIIEQTADVYRGVFGAETILEHHSSVDLQQLDDNDRLRWQLAAENWDAPIVVTTAVQFFESLFSNRPSRCRKLHNIARSVVILDEVQTLPLGLLRPSLRMLASLVHNYGVTALLTTATPPAYERVIDDEITEVIPDPVDLARRLERVRYTTSHQGGPAKMPWAEVAARLQEAPQGMAVVNTRRDARTLHEVLPAESRLHLSTNMCAAHRREVLGEIRRRLAGGEAVHVATTQLVEAGVDLDFPLVMRALAPLERIVQAAGRCNREGRLESGQVIVFEPKEGSMPRGTYETGAYTAKIVFAADPQVDLGNPATHRHYFELLYPTVDLDEHGITALRERFAFEQVARKYRLIPDEAIPVAVPWGEAAELLDRLEATGEVTRDDLRALQPYIISLYPWDHGRALQQGLCRKVLDGVELWRWEGRYEFDIGVVIEEPPQGDIIV